MRKTKRELEAEVESLEQENSEMYDRLTNVHDSLAEYLYDGDSDGDDEEDGDEEE